LLAGRFEVIYTIEDDLLEREEGAATALFG
jgi:hypothetical protein